MRKVLIYVAAATISFMVMYSAYYYTQTNRLGGGFVADADTTGTTLMRPHPYEPSGDKNIVYSAGILNAMLRNGITVQSAAPEDFVQLMNDDSYIGMAGPYSKAALTKLDEDLQKKFPNHPPLQLHKTAEGTSTLFSYVFKNAFLPSNFQQAGFMRYKGKEVRGILYTPDTKDSGTVQLFVSPDGKSLGLRVILADGDECIWFSAPNMQDIVLSFKDFRKMMASQPPRKLKAEETILFPELDFFLSKTYKKAELEEFFKPSRSDFNNIEDRLKLRTTPPKSASGSDKEAKATFVFNNDLLFCVKKKNAVFPYVAVLMHNADLLKR